MTGADRGGHWREAVAVSLVVLTGAAYLWLQLRQGWIPHDEGTLGQSALRLLRGELPHADFDAMYTGGLAALHALAFEIGGVRMTVPRFVLWGTFVLWMPISYWIARRFAGPLLSSVAVLLMVTWSVPNYPAAMPSWYNLFLATFGTAALLQYLESRRHRWLVAAGLCAGASILFKIIGVFFLAAAGLFLVALEQAENSRDGGRASPDASSAGYRVIVLGLCLAALAVLVGVVDRSNRAGNVVYFTLPLGVLVAVLAWADTSVGSVTSARRFRALLGRAAPLLAGAAVPVLLFLVPYAATGALDELARGLFVLPARRVSGAAAPMPGPSTWGWALVAAAPLAAAAVLPSRSRWLLAVAAAVGAAWIVLNGGQDRVYRAAWRSIRPLLPLTVLGGAAVLVRRRANAGGGPWSERELATLLLLAVISLCSLVQFPFGAPIYFMYVGPLLVPAVLAVACLLPRPKSLTPLVLVLFCFHLFFAARWLNTGFIRKMGLWYEPNPHTARLELPRAGLLVSEFEKREYERLVAELDEHARGPYMYAGPDSPEVYFLAGRRNPTRALFEFLSVDDLGGKALLSVLGEHDVSVVAVNRHPSFSEPLEEGTLEILAERYPHSEQIGHFLVRWR